MFAPIVLFTYNRANHARQAVDSLLINQEANESDLIIYSDGPKGLSDAVAVEENRKYIHSIKGFKSIEIIERDHNWGLANSLIDGITTVVNKYGKVIVVEDDLEVSPFFLKYMNDALTKYELNEKVSAISAFVNPIKKRLPETFFLRYFACWGWGTWKRGWDLFNPDPNYLLSKFESRQQIHLFDIDSSEFFYDMLKMQAKGRINSWAIRFHASSFLANKLILYPGRSLTFQTGMDGSGIHCGNSDTYSDVILSQSPIDLSGDIPVEMSEIVYNLYKKFYRKAYGNDFKTWFRRRIRGVLKRLKKVLLICK